MAGITTGGGGVRLTFALEGGQKVDVMLSRLRRNISNWLPFFRDYVAPRFFGTLVRNFETQGGYVGGWRPLSERYARWKAIHFPGKTILRRRDVLIGSVTWSGSRPGRGGVFRATETSAEMGTSVRYAVYHNRGTGRLPQRQILFLPTGASEGYGRLMNQFVQDQIASARLAARSQGVA